MDIDENDDDCGIKRPFDNDVVWFDGEKKLGTC